MKSVGKDIITPDALVLHQTTSAIGIVVWNEKRKGKLYANVKYDENFIVCSAAEELRPLTRPEFIRYRIDSWVNKRLWGASFAAGIIATSSVFTAIFVLRASEFLGGIAKIKNMVI
ncbi:MAG: hypothetical protein AAF764_00165 [Pseudomonadota bacterium]